MLNILEVTQISFRLIGLRYSILIFLAISLTSSLLLFADGILSGYEKSLLVKIIGSTPHVAILLEKKVNDIEIDDLKNSIRKIAPISFSAKGLAYSGSADIFTIGIAENLNAVDELNEEWVREELKSQSPEVFFKGMEYSETYSEYLSKVLLKFKTSKKTNTSAVNDIYTYQSPDDWDDALIFRKPIAFPPSLYREIIDPYISQANYPFIRMTESGKFFEKNSDNKNKTIEYVVVAGLDTPISDDTVPIITAYETMEYVLNGTTKGENFYNYLELFFENPMDSEKISKSLKNVMDKDTIITAWSDKFKSEVALIGIFSLLFLSVVIGASVSIGLLLSSLLDIIVRRKRRQISVFLAIGSDKSLIMKIFIFYSMSIGLIGCISSIFITKLINFWLLYFINLKADNFNNFSIFRVLHHKLQGMPPPNDVSISAILMMLGSVLLISFISSYQSAVDASNINPIEGLKES